MGAQDPIKSPYNTVLLKPKPNMAESGASAPAQSPDANATTL